MSSNNLDVLISHWKEKKFLPLYWIEGEETFFIDQAINYVEQHLQTPQEQTFDRAIVYGKDSSVESLYNYFRKAPLKCSFQLVIVKEAQQFKDIELLEHYVTNPTKSTIVVFAYKNKKLDGRGKLSKAVAKNGMLVHFKKMYDNQINLWIKAEVKKNQNTIEDKAVALLMEFAGSDLSVLHNELQKINVNLGKDKLITIADVEHMVGISKEYNLFELQNALGAKDFKRIFSIINYFIKNPKAAPLVLVVTTLYSYFTKLSVCHENASKSQAELAIILQVNPFFVKDYLNAIKNYSYQNIQRNIIILHQYNLKNLGVNTATINESELLKELVSKLIA